MTPVTPVTPEGIAEEIRTTFLFEALTDDQLAYLASAGRISEYPERAEIYHEGEEATCFFVLLDGEVQMWKRVSGEDVLQVTSAQRGVYAGAVRAFVPSAGYQTYPNALRTTRPSRFFELPAEAFTYVIQTWFPMAAHLLDGLFLGLTNMEALTSQREKLIALGKLSAGLAHELNNPASSAVRATQALRHRIPDAQHALALLTPALAPVASLMEEALGRARAAEPLSPLEAGDREDELGGWLERWGVDGSWELAPTLAAAGVDGDWLDRLAAAAGDECFEAALRWVVARIDIDSLVNELEEAAARVSTLVASIKEYSHMDRTPYAPTNVHDGLESTLAMLGHKLRDGVEVVRDYDRSLPAILAYGSELNQVWTNLIDNAIDAMDGKGQLTVRTHRDGDRLVVEIGDTGAGIPEAHQRRVFEPFFTTKDVGKGTGLGLDIVYRVVTQRHAGAISVDSKPGDTRFRVSLPLDPPTSM